MVDCLPVCSNERVIACQTFSYAVCNDVNSAIWYLQDLNSGSMQQTFVGPPQNAASSSNNNCSHTNAPTSRGIIVEVRYIYYIIKHCSLISFREVAYVCRA